jgi:hypothetical protein
MASGTSTTWTRLFYHRSLRRLVAIDLKLGSFDAAYKGQKELYMRWLDRYERRAGRGDGPLGSSCAARRTMSRSSCCSSTGARSGWRSIWWSCRQRDCWRPSCTKPYGWREGERTRNVRLGGCRKIGCYGGEAEGQEDGGGGAGNAR